MATKKKAATPLPVWENPIPSWEVWRSDYESLCTTDVWTSADWPKRGELLRARAAKRYRRYGQDAIVRWIEQAPKTLWVHNARVLEKDPRG
jgi:hypothetical protein